MFGPHETNLAHGRALSDRHVAYYERRAAGGAGVIVVEEASVHGSDWPYERAPLAADAGPGWSAIAAACHHHGAVVLAALGHSGGQGSSAYSQMPLLAPSRVPEVNTREVPKWMEVDDIDVVVSSFAEAARSAVEAGCDGVEINAGQYSLIRQFLSALTNQRGDEWSAGTRFAREVLTTVRAAVGADHIVALRLSADELAPWAGIVPEVGAQIAAELAEWVDLITVVRGAIFSTAATRPDGHTEPGFNLELASQVRDAVRERHGERVAVFAQGSIVDVGQARWALDEARCDGVEMTRAQIADADLVAKVRADRAAHIRPCILCNQTCNVRDARNPIVTCVVDPRSGYEWHDAEPAVAGVSNDQRPKRSVVVVGGGPAGLEAARVAALAGRSVTLHERRGRLGGMTTVAAAGSGRSRLAAIAEWLAVEVERLGVVVRLGSEVAAGDLDPDADVVIATGSVDAPASYKVSRSAVVVTAAEFLERGEAVLPDGPVFVWDPIGGPVAVSIAERLSAPGEGPSRSVVLATQDNIVGNELSRSGDLAPANARLQQAGVVLERRTLLRSVRKGGVEVEDRFSGETRTIKAAVVIDCGHRLPDEDLYRAVSSDDDRTAAASRRRVVRAGDSVAPRTILEAIREGRAAIAALDGDVAVSDGVAMGPKRLGSEAGH